MHRPGVVVGVLLAQEVRPADRPDEQRAAAEQERGVLAAAQVGDLVRDMLGSVAGRVAGREPQRADVERLAVARRGVVVAKLRSGADHVPRPGQGREVAPARDVVVVEMGLDDMGDPDVELTGRREIDVDVPARVDDRGDAGDIVGDERRQMPEPLDPELADLHAHERSTGPGWPGRLPTRVDGPAIMGRRSKGEG